MEGKKGKVWILGGPTASGKSELAILLAQRTGAVIINADSQQVYAPLRVLTARPSAADEARAEHRLYGVMDGMEACSAGKWLAMAKEEIARAWVQGRPALAVGGTGLYLQVLQEGIAPVPDIAAEIRRRVAEAYDSMGETEFRAALRQADPDWERRIKPADRQRLLRGMEVWKGTGRTLSSWQKEKVVPPYPLTVFTVFRMAAQREEVYRRCDLRVLRMLEEGAVEEVSRLSLPREAAVRKVIGVAEIEAWLEGRMTREEALYAIRLKTRHYAKRQFTWFRHRQAGAREVANVAEMMEQLGG